MSSPSSIKLVPIDIGGPNANSISYNSQNVSLLVNGNSYFKNDVYVDGSLNIQGVDISNFDSSMNSINTSLQSQINTIDTMLGTLEENTTNITYSNQTSTISSNYLQVGGNSNGSYLSGSKSTFGYITGNLAVSNAETDFVNSYTGDTSSSDKAFAFHKHYSDTSGNLIFDIQNDGSINLYNNLKTNGNGIYTNSGGLVTEAQISYLNSVSSNIQTQLNTISGNLFGVDSDIVTINQAITDLTFDNTSNTSNMNANFKITNGELILDNGGASVTQIKLKDLSLSSQQYIDFFTDNNYSTVTPQSRISFEGDGNYSGDFVFYLNITGYHSPSLFKAMTIKNSGKILLGNGSYSLPAAGPSGGNQYLTTDTSGNLNFTTDLTCDLVNSNTIYATTGAIQSISAQNMTITNPINFTGVSHMMTQIGSSFNCNLSAGGSVYSLLIGSSPSNYGYYILHIDNSDKSNISYNYFAEILLSSSTAFITKTNYNSIYSVTAINSGIQISCTQTGGSTNFYAYALQIY